MEAVGFCSPQNLGTNYNGFSKLLQHLQPRKDSNPNLLWPDRAFDIEKAIGSRAALLGKQSGGVDQQGTKTSQPSQAGASDLSSDLS